MIEIRKLRREEAGAYRAFRLAALQAFPSAFGSNHWDESRKPLSFYEDRIGSSASSDDFIIGAFRADALSGTCCFARHVRRTERHGGTLYGMAVARQEQGQGLGARLVRALICEARKIDGLLQIELSFTEGNEPAQRLYESMGFRAYGIKPRATIVDGVPHNKVAMMLRIE